MSDTNEDEIKAICEAVAAKVASMHENADPAVKAALEDHARNNDALRRKLEAAIINGTAARNGYERLKAELDRLRSERSKPVAEPDWHNAAKMYAKCSACPLGLDVLPGDPAPQHSLWGVAGKDAPRCEGSGQPTRAYRPVLDGKGGLIGVHEFQLLHEVAAPASDQPAEPVAGHSVDPVVRLAIPIRELIDAFAGAEALCGGPIKYPSEMAGVVVRLAKAQAEKQPEVKSEAERRLEALEARLNGMAMSDVALEKGLDKSDARLAVLEKRLADVEGRCVARLDRLSEWQSRDAKAAAAAIEALEKRMAEMEARLTVGERVNSLAASVEGLTDRVKALEGGAKGKTNERLYRVRSEGGAAAAGVREGSRFFECTRFRSVADSNRLALQGAGVPKCWLEMSEDNGRTWKRCEENEHA